MKSKFVEKPYVSCIVAAGGSGTRMGKKINKLFLEACGIPILAHTLMALQKSEYIDEIIISAREEDILYIADIVAEFKTDKVKSIVKGGENRSQSVKAAILEISDCADLIAVHDGARPLIDEGSIEAVVLDAKKFGAAALGVRPKATLKQEGEGGFIDKTIDRNKVYEIQTPQIFEKNLFLEAYNADESVLTEATDDCSLVERIGKKIKIIKGSYLNIKVTTPEDIAICEALLNFMEAEI